MLHAAFLLVPGRGLPADDEPAGKSLLEATLVAPVRAAPPPPASRPAPPPRRDPTLRTPVAEDAPPPVQEFAAAPVVPQAERPPPPEDPSPAVAPAPEAAVPPAPTFRADFAAGWPADGRIVFQVTRGEDGLIIGQSTHEWRHENGRYELRARTETVGLAALFRPASVEQISRGELGTQGLQPAAFESLRNGKPRESVILDAAQGRVQHGDGRHASFAAGMQDLLSIFYQLGALLPEVKRTELPIAQGRKTTTYRVDWVAAEILDGPQGPRSVHHYRIVAGDKADSTDVWLDAASRLPLKIRHRDRKGEVFDQVATSIELGKTQ
jgi:hypothetical protein